MMARAESLSATVTRLYAALARYPFNPEMDMCPHCREPGDYVHLGESLRRLEARDLSAFQSRAISTVGGPQDYLHFFPRLFELSLQGAPGFEPTTLASKLRASGWTRLPPEEHEAIEGAIHVAWRTLLAHPPRPLRGSEESPVQWETTEALGMLERLYPEVQPFLDAWPLDEVPPLLHVAVLACDAAPIPNPPDDALASWLRRPELAAAMERAERRAAGEPAGLLGSALAALRRVASFFPAAATSPAPPTMAAELAKASLAQLEAAWNEWSVIGNGLGAANSPMPDDWAEIAQAVGEELARRRRGSRRGEGSGD